MLFVKELKLWSARHGLGVKELASRCGVSPSYLAHIGRYGRIPSKPIILLLALNFEMREPELLLKAAGIHDAWPFNVGTRLSESCAEDDPGFLSVKLDMNGLVEALTGAMRNRTTG